MTNLQKPVSRAELKRERQSIKRQVERAVYKFVDERDKRSCRVCGRRGVVDGVGILARLHHHHLKFRSAGGMDTSENVILCCSQCHADIHAHRVTVEGDANGTLTIRRTE